MWKRREFPFGAAICLVIVLTFFWERNQYAWRVPVWKDGVRRFYTYKGDPHAAVEYRLPCDHLPSDLRERLHPWLKSFVGKSESEARELLVRRWAEAPEFLHPLRERLLEFRPCSILVRGEQCYVGVYRDKDEVDGFYVAPPPGAESIEAISKRFEPDTRDAIKQFLTHFGGLRESPPPTSGDFMFDRLDTVDDMGYFTSNHSTEFDSWLVLFTALNGDLLLVSPSGEIGWFKLENYFVDRLAISLEQLPEHFAQFKFDDYPFDAHGRPPYDDVFP